MASRPDVPLPPPVSVEGKLAELDNVPLFMRSLPDDVSSNETVEALQSLIYEDPPNEVAKGFKDQGNEYFKRKRFREALGFYTQGIDAKPDDPSIREALLSNRAACNLELKNYGSVLRDCGAVLSLNPGSSKAFYRSALALKALDRLDESLDACRRCLEFDQDNTVMQNLMQSVLNTKTAQENKLRQKQELLKQEEETSKLLAGALKDRHIFVVSTSQSNPNQYGFPHFQPSEPKPWSFATTLVFPVFFLYPEHSTSDLVSQFDERSPVLSHIEEILSPKNPPPQWDSSRSYTPQSVVTYATTRKKRLLKVGRKLTLADVFKAAKTSPDGKPDGLELRDGSLALVILLKGEVEHNWVEDYKKTRDSPS